MVLSVTPVIKHLRMLPSINLILLMFFLVGMESVGSKNGVASALYEMMIEMNKSSFEGIVEDKQNRPLS